MNKRILVVDDDRKTVELIQVYLQRDGYRVAAAYNGKEALEQTRRIHPDLVILDVMLPEIDGLEVCELLRAESKVPVIMLTARTSESDKLLGLDRGADDYVTKPFSLRELAARVRAALRRATCAEEEAVQDISFGDIKVSFARHEVSRDGRVVSLTPTEFKLLEMLVRNPGRAFTRPQLIDRIRGLDFDGLERSLDAHIMNLRRKIEPDPLRPHYVKTVWGVGYKLEADPDV
ncbi:MAG: response regulator transcription factor [Chloroflexi bacterium]|nr:response regulator transcription factor [Chloroflexota bacterium]